MHGARALNNYIAGRWTPAAEPTGVLDVTNPATRRRAGAGAAIGERRPTSTLP